MVYINHLIWINLCHVLSPVFGWRIHSCLFQFCQAKLHLPCLVGPPWAQTVCFKTRNQPFYYHKPTVTSKAHLITVSASSQICAKMSRFFWEITGIIIHIHRRVHTCAWHESANASYSGMNHLGPGLDHRLNWQSEFQINSRLEPGPELAC